MAWYKGQYFDVVGFSIATSETARTSMCCHWPLYSQPYWAWHHHVWHDVAADEGSPMGITVAEIICLHKAKNRGIILPLMLKHVFLPEPTDLKAVPPASIWLPRRTCTNNSQRWNVLLLPLNDFPIHRFCLWQRVMTCPVVMFVKTRTLLCQLSNE